MRLSLSFFYSRLFGVGTDAPRFLRGAVTVHKALLLSLLSFVLPCDFTDKKRSKALKVL